MAEKEKTHDIENLKKEYKSLTSKYALPEFEGLAEDFDIERGFDEGTTSFLLRDIRKLINEKISAYLHLFEIFTNPSQAPAFLFSAMKNLTEDDKKKAKEIYNLLAKMGIKTMMLDTIYNEKSEAEFISSSFNQWQSLKKSIFSILGEFEKEIDVEANSSRKGYFG